MGYLYGNPRPLSRKLKINYLSPNLWRLLYLIQNNPVHHTSEKKIWSRSSVVPITFLGTEVLVNAGKRWHRRRISIWMVGFRFGEFTWNRRLALYKAKQLRKKSKGKDKSKGKK